jgi:hypothetical protein
MSQSPRYTTNYPSATAELSPHHSKHPSAIYIPPLYTIPDNVHLPLHAQSARSNFKQNNSIQTTFTLPAIPIPLQLPLSTSAALSPSIPAVVTTNYPRGSNAQWQWREHAKHLSVHRQQLAKVKSTIDTQNHLHFVIKQHRRNNQLSVRAQKIKQGKILQENHEIVQRISKTDKTVKNLHADGNIHNRYNVNYHNSSLNYPVQNKFTQKRIMEQKKIEKENLFLAARIINSKPYVLNKKDLKRFNSQHDKDVINLSKFIHLYPHYTDFSDEDDNNPDAGEERGNDRHEGTELDRQSSISAVPPAAKPKKYKYPVQEEEYSSIDFNDSQEFQEEKINSTNNNSNSGNRPNNAHNAVRPARNNNTIVTISPSSVPTVKISKSGGKIENSLNSFRPGCIYFSQNNAYLASSGAQEPLFYLLQGLSDTGLQQPTQFKLQNFSRNLFNLIDNNGLYMSSNNKNEYLLLKQPNNTDYTETIGDFSEIAQESNNLISSLWTFKEINEEKKQKELCSAYFGKKVAVNRENNIVLVDVNDSSAKSLWLVLHL